MGQYYKPVNLDKKEFLYTHDFGSGLKLMEHSYIGNGIMNAVENMIIPDGDWYKNRLVWAGDYAEGEETILDKATRLFNKKHEAKNIYSIMENKGKKIQPPTKKVDKKYKYLTNYTKQIVIDLSKIKKDKYGYRIHPLSLLVCEGNGLGGGDFYGEDSRIGTWARDIISLEDHIIDGFQLEDGQFKEERS
jgi:hypothetical protein